jgi:hypothetical protein
MILLVYMCVWFEVKGRGLEGEVIRGGVVRRRFVREGGGRRFVNIAIPGGFESSGGALKLVLEGF